MLAPSTALRAGARLLFASAGSPSSLWRAAIRATSRSDREPSGSLLLRVGLLATAGLIGLGGQALAQSGCAKAEFETVVDEAAGALRELARKNTPTFQAKLRQLKDKRGWSDANFLTEAEPLVRDEKIAAFDRTSDELLTRITSASRDEPASGARTCALLSELRAAMRTLVETQTAKWSYMFNKIEKELGR